MKTYKPILIVKRRDIHGQIERDLIAMPPTRHRAPFALTEHGRIGDSHPDDFTTYGDDDQLRHWGSAYDHLTFNR